MFIPGPTSQGVTHAYYTAYCCGYLLDSQPVLSTIWNGLLLLWPISPHFPHRAISSALPLGGALMLDGLAAGVATGLATHKAVEQTDKILHPEEHDLQHDVLYWLQAIHQALAPPANDAIEETMQLYPYPAAYQIDNDFHDRAHVCVLFYTSTPMRLDTTLGGSISKTVGPGWIQIDQAGFLSTTDAQTHVITISYRDDALGVSL